MEIGKQKRELELARRRCLFEVILASDQKDDAAYGAAVRVLVRDLLKIQSKRIKQNRGAWSEKEKAILAECLAGSEWIGIKLDAAEKVLARSRGQISAMAGNLGLK